MHRILFKNGIMGIENVGGDIDKVTGKRCTFAYFPWNWDRGDGCIVRLVAIVDPARQISHRAREELLMHVKRFADAKAYDAPNHRGCTSLRLFGAEAGGTKGLICRRCRISCPAAAPGPTPRRPRRSISCLRGELTVIVNGKETVLKANDSCVIEPNETREIINRGNEVCTHRGRGGDAAEVITQRVVPARRRGTQ